MRGLPARLLAAPMDARAAWGGTKAGQSSPQTALATMRKGGRFHLSERRERMLAPPSYSRDTPGTIGPRRFDFPPAPSYRRSTFRGAPPGCGARIRTFSSSREVSMKRLVALLAVSLWSATALAQPFQNGSFETGGVTPCNTFNVPAGSTLITGWTVSVGNVDWLGAPVPACGWQASNGGASLDLVGSGAGGIGGVQQTFDTIPGRTYVVLFDLAGNSGAPPTIKPLAVTVNGVTTNFTFDTTGTSGTNMGWVTRSVQFTATGASATLNFVSDVSPSGGTLNAGAALDNVRVQLLGDGAASAPIPLDWAHVGAMLLLLLTAAYVVPRHVRRR
jgi:choice-of-anchor C domain-containing protein